MNKVKLKNLESYKLVSVDETRHKICLYLDSYIKCFFVRNGVHPFKPLFNKKMLSHCLPFLYELQPLA